MVTSSFDPHFERIFSKIKDKTLKEKIVKQFYNLVFPPFYERWRKVLVV